MPSRPNIVLLFADDQRFDTINALGNKEIQTPNLDALVERGTTFTNAHIPGGTSGAVCMPSRAMLHTGRTLFHLQGAGQEIPEDHTLLGEHLGKNGYQTFGTGKWHNGHSAYNRSFSDGDEIMFGGMADHWNVPMFHYDKSGEYPRGCPIVYQPTENNILSDRNCDHIHVGKHSSDIVSGAAVDFLNNYKDEDPYFVYVSFLAPHDPRTMPEKFRKMYNPENIKLPENYMGGHPFNNGALQTRDEKLAPWPRDPDETKRHIAEYYGIISHLDDCVGKVIAAVEARGELENTVFVFAGDNGLALGQHGLMGKQNLYEHSVRVPLLLAGPGINKNSKRDDYVYLLDIFPTLCDIINLPVPETVDGRSFLPALSGKDFASRESLYLAFTSLQRGMKNKKHKLIEYVVDGKHNMTQLFDLENDPWEINNLADDEEHKGTIEKLREEMFKLRDEWDDCESKLGKAFWDGF
ncbi:MAG: sulfatase-like hydrolase/transferase [Planctomycetota bacterium]|jgi:arylsulfatase A-like enzyme